jgi:hypothetical protein
VHRWMLQCVMRQGEGDQSDYQLILSCLACPPSTGAAAI